MAAEPERNGMNKVLFLMCLSGIGLQLHAQHISQFQQFDTLIAPTVDLTDISSLTVEEGSALPYTVYSYIKQGSESAVGLSLKGDEDDISSLEIVWVANNLDKKCEFMLPRCETQDDQSTTYKYLAMILEYQKKGNAFRVGARIKQYPLKLDAVLRSPQLEVTDPQTLQAAAMLQNDPYAEYGEVTSIEPLSDPRNGHEIGAKVSIDICDIGQSELIPCYGGLLAYYKEETNKQAITYVHEKKGLYVHRYSVVHKAMGEAVIKETPLHLETKGFFAIAATMSLGVLYAASKVYSWFGDAKSSGV